MAASNESESSTENPFGKVSRLRGLLFEYTTLAASLFGIVLLAILLIYVTIDAFGLEAADPLWFVSYLVTVVGPSAGLVLYSMRDRSFGRVAAGTTGRLAGGIVGALAIIVLFIVLDVQMWLLVYTLGLLPTAVVYLYGRTTGRSWALFPVPQLTLVVGMIAGILLKGPVSVYPTDWIIHLWTLGLPIAAITAYIVSERTDGNRQQALVAGAVTLIGAAAAGPALTIATGVPQPVGTLFFLTTVVPVGLFIQRVWETHRGRARLGILAPVSVVVGALVGKLLIDALAVTQPDPWLTWQYLTAAPSRFPQEAGLYPAIIGSVFIISLVAVFSFVLGVSTALFLEEYSRQSGPAGTVTRLIQVNISNLAGVPSVVYGLLGLALFVNLVGLGFGTVIVAALTLSLLILPIVVISAQEAIRSVPDSLREASYGMGATRWQTVRDVVLPEALPGILTGSILALGRAIGETAPLLMIGVATTAFTAPEGLLSRTSAMPMQIFAWAFYPSEEFRYGVVAAGVVTLLAVLLTMNSIAILVRNKYQKR